MDAGDNLALAMDDEEILKLQKIVEKKRRMKNNLSSSNAVRKEGPEIGPMLHDKNTTIYAWFEVSKGSEKPPKKERILLKDKPVYQMVEKLIRLEEETCERKIVRAGHKRKYNIEHSEMHSDGTNRQKTQITAELTEERREMSNKKNKFIPHSNHSIQKKTKSRDKNIVLCISGKGDNRNESSDLKILYNRNPAPETRFNQNRINCVTRGTNTDIAQAPKLLTEILKALSPGERRSEKAEDGKEGSERKERSLIDSCDYFHIGNSGGIRSSSSSLQNYLLVPFIITSNNAQTCKRCNSMDTIKNEQPQACFSPRKKNIVRTHRSSTDLRSDSLNLHVKAGHGVAADSAPESESLFNGGKETNVSEPKESSREPCLKGPEYFLEEVKTLQLKLNAIIKGLEMNSELLSQRKLESSEANRNDSKARGEELESSVNSTVIPVKEGDAIETDSAPTTPRDALSKLDCLLAATRQNNSQDFSVQVELVRSKPDLSPSPENATSTEPPKMDDEMGACEKQLKCHKLNQFPSETRVVVESSRKMNKRRAVFSKSSTHFPASKEVHAIKLRKASSVTATTNVALQFFCSLEENSKCSDKKQPEPEEKASPPSPESDEKNLAVVKYEVQGKASKHGEFDEQNKIVIPLRDKEGFREGTVNIKQGAKVAKIKIVGNAVISGKNKREADIGKIKVQVQESSSIKISNKISKRPKTSGSFSANNSIKGEANKEIENKKVTLKVKPEGCGKTIKRDSTANSGGVKKVGQAQKMAKTADSGTKPGKTGAPSIEPPPTPPHPQSAQNSPRPKKAETETARAASRGNESEIEPVDRRPRVSHTKTLLTVVENQENEAAKQLTELERKNRQNPTKSHALQESEAPLIEEKAGAEAKPPSLPPAEPFQTENTCMQSKDLVRDAVRCPVTARDVFKESLSVNEQANGDNQAQAVKSIWALTKVILYQDGTQSFEVLEASSTPPGFHLNQDKTSEKSDSKDTDNSEEKHR